MRLNGLSPLFKCPYMFVCLLFVCLCTRLFESMLIFMLECITTKETLGNSFINTDFFFVNSDLPNLGNFAAFQF